MPPLDNDEGARGCTAALTGGLVLKEAAKVHAEGLSAGQFRHGPVELADHNLTVVVIEGLPATAELNRRLAGDLVAYGARVCWLGSADGAGWPVLPAPRSSDLARPITEVVPFQLLSVRLAEASGLEPGLFRNGAKVTATE
jgi:glutamine---fructose-6-phosphate transaminase (isomerizing)